MGQPFIDGGLIENARDALRNAGLELVEHDLVIASKREARECFSRFKKMDDLDAVVLYDDLVAFCELTGIKAIAL